MRHAAETALRRCYNRLTATHEGTAESIGFRKGNGIHLTIERNRRPVFIIGCHRSGTNLLYDILLSAGGFAVYRGYLPVYETLIPHFGRLGSRSNREKLVDAWMRSKGFARAAVEAGTLSSKLSSECQTGGDFIRIVMNQIAQKQGAGRWALYGPDNVLHMRQIKKELPDALFVHIIRDGRDIALSLMKMQGFRPFPWSRKTPGLLETALYWEWMVRKGREHGERIPDYTEVHYEELVTHRREVVNRLAEFLDHDLDCDRIQANRLGRLSESNSSFRDETEATNPVERWKKKLSREQIGELEAIIGPTLEKFGYPLDVSQEQRKVGFRWKVLASIYPSFLATKQWLKLNTALGHFADLSVLELRDSPLGQSD
jgi:hypothetical protein